MADFNKEQTTIPAYQPEHEHEQAPDLPPRTDQQQLQHDNPTDYNQEQKYAPPPLRISRRSTVEGQDISSPIHYSRDPKTLVAYLVPFPKPKLHNVPADAIPQRFLIYTPPPPPLSKPKEGEKEGKVHKIQRKWEEEIREAKTGNHKTASWKGIKGKVTKGINWGMGQTKTANLEFLNRIGANPSEPDKHAEDGHPEGEDTKATVKLEEMLLVYPSSMPADDQSLRQEFVNTMLRSKSKAERDAIIATGLLPVSACIDLLATLVWPFGGLLEIDAVWAFASIRGAKNSRSVTKRLTSSTTDLGSEKENKLSLNFTPSPRLAVLEQYLAAKCHERDSKMFPPAGSTPTETEVLEAIGWTPSSKGGEEKNWEDEQWEITETKDDLKSVMHKAAKEWVKWSKLYEKSPQKALKK
ncbi:hypothetical protein EJ03DRAFT_382630 [Teratosphaeria nubilosa]|uniref:Secreted protein n=1 Tax=Teratosphaeria nubilosa TaxID=161662 RepID=A0A6G1LA67_9PEZI|nr:hypothetical protein EJ03DRAFT_382630 [Teratosphaeria nubilosa]